MAHETIEARVARLETLGEALLRDIGRHDRDLDTLSPIVGQVIEFGAEVRALIDDLDDLKGDLKERAGMSLTLKVALIGGSCALLAALVTAVAQIVTS